MSRTTIYRLGLLAIAIGVAGMADVLPFDNAVFGPRYAEGAARMSMMASVWIGMAGMVVAAVIATKLGAVRAGMAGLGVAMIGVAVATLGSRYVGSALMSFGLGIFRPCPLGAAAAIVTEQRLGRLRFLAMSAAAIACSAATDSSSILGRDLFELLEPEGHGAGITVLALLGIATLCIAWSLRMSRARTAAQPVADAPYRMAAPAPVAVDEPPADVPLPIGRTVRGVVLLLLPIMLLVSWTYRTTMFSQLRSAGFTSSAMPVVRLLVAGAAATYFVKAVRRADARTPLSVFGYALVLFGAGTVISRWTASSGDDFVATLAALLIALSTPFLWSISNGYAALAVPPRYATASVAAWLIALSLLLWFIGTALPGFLRQPLLFLSLVIVGAGLYLLRRATALHRSLFDPASLDDVSGSGTTPRS